jgi:hypothetical protein
MTLIGRFNRWFQRLPTPDDPERTTSDEVPRPRPKPADLGAKLRARDERRARIEDCRKMRRSDPRARGVIATVARDAVRGGVQITVEDGPTAERAQEIADALMLRLKLNHRLDDWLRLAFDDGDLFLEHGVDSQNRIALVTRKPTLEMRRHSDYTDRFADPTAAYWMGESWDDTPPRDAIWFAQWQITHARWDHDDGQRYGFPLFGAARDSYLRMREGEYDVAVRRKTRAGLRFVHKLIGANGDQVEAYKLRNQDTLDDPNIALADFFINGENGSGIDAVQGDANLDAIGDVLHQMRTWAIAAPIPLPLIGYGENINRDVLKEQQDQYNRALGEVTSWAIGDIVEPLVRLQWLLLGIYPESLTYTISPPSMDVLTATTARDAADAAIKLKAAGLPPEQLWPLVARLIPTLDAQAVLDTLVEMNALEPSEAARLAQEAGALQGVQMQRMGQVLKVLKGGA